MFRLLGFDPDEIVQEFLSGGATVKVMRVRLSSWNMVGDVVQASREHQVTSVLCDNTTWMARARSPAEAARTAPVARGVRSLKQMRETRLNEGAAGDIWDIEGSYRPGGECIWLSSDGWANEHMLMWCDPNTGTWAINADIVKALSMDVPPHEWLATLL